MQRSHPRSKRSNEAGQALPLLGLFFMVLVGFTALSIDVGRYVWARTSMQAGVDAAALAAAQSMPSQTAAEAKAAEYWLDNSGFIQSQGQNVSFEVTYPDGNKAIAVRGEADIPTWFAKFFGVPKWHVWAEGEAESQVLDIAVVLDISGSMCKHPTLPSFPEVESGNALLSPGQMNPAGGFAFPKLASAISSGTGSSITITLNDVRVFTSTNASNNRTNFGGSSSSGNQWNSTTPYWQRTFNSGGTVRAGIIGIANASGTAYELFKITAVNVGANTLTVTRAQQNVNLGVWTSQMAHPAGAEIWANRYTGPNGSAYCDAVSKYKASATVDGPHEPFDSAINSAKYFVSLFNQSYDKIGLATFSTDGAINQNLSSSWGTLNSAMNNIFYPNGSTNIAHGIGRGRAILDGTGKRANAVRVMVVLTDGIPNNYCTNGYDSSSCSNGTTSDPTSCPAPSNASISAAINQAAVAKAADITVYTIGLGGGVLDCILEDIAAAGGGEYYKAPTPEQLDEAFQAIAERTHIALVR